jgi:uncharacterized protein YbjT (DUF2867 family)
MRILLTGVTGYIGQRLLPVLAKDGHYLICCVRDAKRFDVPQNITDQVSVIEVDFLKPETLTKIPTDIDGAFYLIHSMSGNDDFSSLELQCATNFREAVATTNLQQVIYLSGIVNDDNLSKHLASRKAVEEELSKGNYQLTTLRAGIIIGSGSASFEIMRDLAEKLPVMIAPKWLKTRCQPIGIRDVIDFLWKSLLDERTYGQSFDIGGPDVLTYKEMLLGYASVRGFKRYIFTVPVMTPRLSSYWLYFITSTSYPLAVALVNSMKIEVVAKDNRLAGLLGIEPLPYQVALERTFQKIQKNEIISSWTDALSSGLLDNNFSDYINVPTYGCFVDKRTRAVEEPQKTLDRIWQIGGQTGWYYGDWLWKIRGYLDKLVGGVGLRRGRTHHDQLSVGDALDFWRVLYADKEEGRLMLFAEMLLPGEAWLEFNLKEGKLVQTATFRPKGILGRLYWYAVLPFHGFIFNGMIDALAGANSEGL